MGQQQDQDTLKTLPMKRGFSLAVGTGKFDYISRFGARNYFKYLIILYCLLLGHLPPITSRGTLKMRKGDQ